jgi:hypothetical protein
MKIKRFAPLASVLLVAVLALAVAAPFASAAKAPTVTGIVHACIKTKGKKSQRGSIRIVTTGPAGVTGAAGANGAQGEKGSAAVVELQLQEVISNQTKEIQQLTTNVLGLTKEVADLEGTLGTVEKTVGTLGTTVGTLGTNLTTTLTANQKATCQTLGTVSGQVKSVTGSLNSLATNLLNVELLGLHVLKVGETTPVTETLPKEVSCP